MRNASRSSGGGRASDYIVPNGERRDAADTITLYAYPLLFHETMKALMGVYVQHQWTRNRPPSTAACGLI